MISKMQFINTKPVVKGVCTRCAGYKTVKQQHMGGEVRYVQCSRCSGSGKEPIGRWERFKALFRGETCEV